MWVAVNINTYHGLLEVYGLFEKEEKALSYIEDQKNPRLWTVRKVNGVYGNKT